MPTIAEVSWWLKAKPLLVQVSSISSLIPTIFSVCNGDSSTFEKLTKYAFGTYKINLSMTIDIIKYEQKLANRLNEFSGSFMSNAKWKKLFLKLSKNKDIVSKCFIKDVFEENLNDIEIPSVENFLNTFHDKGVKDVTTGGTLTFKQIEWIEFPIQWTTKREMRGQTLEPQKFTQDLLQIRKILHEVGQLEIELNEDKLVIYGYK